MTVRCASCKGVQELNTSSDNLVLIGVFLTAVLFQFPSSLIAASLALLLLCLVTEIFSAVRMARLGVYRLTDIQAPPLMSLLRDESRAMASVRHKSSARSTVYCAPTAIQTTAFTLGGFRPKLVVTGRLCVAAKSFPNETRMILRHELAHLDNHDNWLWQMLISTVLSVICVVLIDIRNNGNLPAETALFSFSGVLVSIYLLLLYFRRREFLADAIAINHTEDRISYLRMMEKAQPHQRSWFHPSPADRIAAIQCDSPVLRTNLVMLLFVIACFAGVIADVFVSNHQELSIVGIIALVVGGLVFLRAFAVEVLKGPRRKVPIPSVESEVRPLPRAGYLSPLAELFGIGGVHIDLIRASALPISMIVSSLIFFILNPGDRFTFSGLEMGRFAWNDIGFPFLLLLMLRYRRDLMEVGTAVAAPACLVLPLFNPFAHHYSLDPSLFWGWVFGVACLGAAVARIRNTFLGLSIGYLFLLFLGNLAEIQLIRSEVLASIFMAGTFVLILNVTRKSHRKRSDPDPDA